MRVKIQAGGEKRERGDFPLPEGLGKSKTFFEDVAGAEPHAISKTLR